MYRTAFNSTTGPVVIDAEGHSIGGGEWGTVNPDDPHAAALLASGALVLVEVNPDAPGMNPNAAAAARRTSEMVGDSLPKRSSPAKKEA